MNNANSIFNYYLLDATGNVMCIYTRHGDTLTVAERPLYGTKRLGELRQQIKIGVNGLLLNYNTATIGFRHYELTDHLGNVMAVVSDRKTLSPDSVYYPVVISTTDYYPFGYPIPDRSSDLGEYRYGFNGQESDDEVYGEKLAYSFEYRTHDTRLGRFWSVDPLTKDYPYWTPYQFAGNMPIWAKELEGLEPEKVINTANEYQGTPYEYGGKKPAFKGGLPENMTHDWYMKNVGYPSSSIKSKGGTGSRWNNPNYKNKINLDQYLKNGATSCGMDCSGLTAIAFNSDKQKLMHNIPAGRAIDQRQKFADAFNNNTGYLGYDFSNVSKGDLVFNTSASHVMIATGNIRKQNGKIQIEVTNAPETGEYVKTQWRTVKTGWTFGHTWRTTDNILPPVTVHAKFNSKPQ